MRLSRHWRLGQVQGPHRHEGAGACEVALRRGTAARHEVRLIKLSAFGKPPNDAKAKVKEMRRATKATVKESESDIQVLFQNVLF